MARTNAFNPNRLSKYNFKFISIEEVLVLELILYFYQKKALDALSISRIEAEIGLKRGRIERALDDLVEKGFITIQSDKFRIHIRVDVDAIVGKLSKLLVTDNKYLQQYFYYVQNPNAFKKSTQRRSVIARKTGKNKSKGSNDKVQMSLF